MQAHKLKLDLKNGVVFAFCECGQWERMPNIRAELPSEIMNLGTEHDMLN